MISISREALPGAVLFPAIKYKDTKSDTGELKGSDSVAESTHSSIVPSSTSLKGSEETGDLPIEDKDPNPTPPQSPSQEQVHRFLVVSRERFIVLDSGGSGIGSKATVKSNHHLTELLKMTFRKSDPELICLYLGPEGKIRQYRVSMRKEFVESLQKNMQRFK